MLMLGTLLSVIFCSCGDEVEGRITVNDAAPSQVSNVNATSGPGEVYLTWNAPSDASFMYTQIEYINSKGENKSIFIAKDKAESNGTFKATVSGFANTDPVKFSLSACSVRGNNKGAITIEKAPDTPAFAAVAGTVKLESNYGGVTVSWENTSIVPVYVALDYAVKSDATKKGTVKFKVDGKTKGSRFAALTFGNGETTTEAYTIQVTTQDEEGNASDVFAFEKSLLAMEKIADKSAWSFPGYKDSYDAAIGYNSQEAGGEGAAPNGRVIAMIDGNNNTFWHTAWTAAYKKTYPHFFILDLGANTEITNMDIRRRTGNAGTHKGQTISTCSDEGAADKGNPDSWNWTSHGATSFDPTTDNPQLYGFAAAPLTARYIKVYFSASDKGTGDFVMISEINVYAPKK